MFQFGTLQFAIASQLSGSSTRKDKKKKSSGKNDKIKETKVRLHRQKRESEPAKKSCCTRTRIDESKKILRIFVE